MMESREKSIEESRDLCDALLEIVAGDIKGGDALVSFVRDWVEDEQISEDELDEIAVFVATSVQIAERIVMNRFEKELAAAGSGARSLGRLAFASKIQELDNDAMAMIGRATICLVAAIEQYRQLEESDGS